MTNWTILALAIVAEVIATTALKASEGFTRLGPSLVVVAGYGCAFYALSLALRTIPLGLAYAVWSGVGILLLAVIGWLVFKQPLSLVQAGGIVCIVVGILLVYAATNS